MEVNDGKGLYDNMGIVDTMIVDMNNLVKYVVSGQYVAFCTTVVSIVQRLSNLKEGIKSDMDSLNEQIIELHKQIEGGG